MHAYINHCQMFGHNWCTKTMPPRGGRACVPPFSVPQLQIQGLDLIVVLPSKLQSTSITALHHCSGLQGECTHIDDGGLCKALKIWIAVATNARGPNATAASGMHACVYDHV
jgi:hypothetical protein